MNFKKFSTSYRSTLDTLMKQRGMVDANFFNQVRNTIPTSLKIIGEPDTPERQMNCHGFTFNRGSWLPTPEVFQLIQCGVLEEIKKPAVNCIILYIEIGRDIPIIYHSGIYLGNGLVRSKWSNGPIFEHKIFNAPASYGKNVRFYKKN